MGKRRVNFQRCWLPVSRIGLHRRGVERVNCGPKLLDLGEKGVYSSYTLHLLVSVPGFALTQHRPVGDVQRRKECRGAMAEIVVCHAFYVAQAHW